ncbi:PepSY-associated TM helix domain-containing protein [Bordetella sp. 02P26C-1]|uniref:PepSY-associated TM helix domain-containing protein n=1 Tax=Bordetella sp. 02P26C-1 TaxID=2683195 RepID=UPI001355F358|nr:PepSY-associated TM helix domain-containing protein [Bordetella sp. 02P26C-1]MVW77793.1 PepSY domain-containing protein [Bordetella sp. 02P26C-1]
MTVRKDSAPHGEGFRQAMAWLHTWAGLIMGWILFAMFLTGTLAFFRPEMTTWMRPELPAQHRVVAADHAADMAQRYLAQHAPDATRWYIDLPSARAPYLSVLYQVPKPAPGTRGFKRVTLDPQTGQEVTARETRGGDFLYRFHFELEIGPPWGRWLASIAGMFMLIAILSGIVTHKKIFKDFFTFRPAKGGQRAWMDGHNALSVLGLPFHLMITFSGLLIFVAMLLPAGINAAYDYPRQYSEERFPGLAPQKAAPGEAPLLPLGKFVTAAQSLWQGGIAGAVIVANPSKPNAIVSVQRSSEEKVSYARNPPSVQFDGVTGKLLKHHEDNGPAVTAADTVIGLHLGFFAQPVLRWLYFIVSLAGTAMVGTGLVLWVVKRRQKSGAAKSQQLSLRLVDGLNAGSIAGFCLAIVVYFCANRLLPVDLPGRALWETRAFFMVWGLSYLYAFVFPRRQWRDLWALAAVGALALPALNAMTTSRHLAASLADGDWVMAGFDLTAWAAAALMGWIAYKAHRAYAGMPKASRTRAAPSSTTATRVHERHEGTSTVRSPVVVTEASCTSNEVTS